MKIIDRYKTLSPKIKLVLFTSIVLLIIILVTSIIIIITSSNNAARHNDSVSGFKTLVDQNSGETISQGQKAAEQNDIPNSPALYGLNNLLARGISAEQVRIIRAVILAHYAQQNNGKQTVQTVSIVKSANIDHTMAGDGTNTYAAKLVINSQQNKLLKVVINDQQLSVAIGDNDTDMQTIYSSD